VCSGGRASGLGGEAPDLRVTLGFTDPASGDSSNQCAVMGGTLRAARKSGLRYLLSTGKLRI
jgi:hypothetical protein